MSIHTISYRIVARKLCGILPSTSSGSLLSLPAIRSKNLDVKRAYTSEALPVIAAELQRNLPIIQWFQNRILETGTYTQNLVENAGLSSSPLEQLALYTWWKPSSWYRVLLESLHTHCDLSWLAALICATVFIRLSTIYLPALIFWKRTRMEEPKRSFMQRIRSKAGSAALYSTSAGLFLAQYCGIKKMAEVVYPAWTTSGMLSFTDLTIPDPAYILPTLTAVCFTVSSKKWIKTLQIQKTVSNWMLGLHPNNAAYPIAACSFFVASNVPSAVCIYWITSSVISSMHATILNSQAARSLLCLPSVYADSTELRRAELLNYINEMRRKRAAELTAAEQKKIAEAAKEAQKIDELKEIRVKELEALQLERDALFPDPWANNGSGRLRSKIMEMMEERKQEAARTDAAAKAGKPKPVIESNTQKLEINKIAVNES